MIPKGSLGVAVIVLIFTAACDRQVPRVTERPSSASAAPGEPTSGQPSTIVVAETGGVSVIDSETGRRLRRLTRSADSGADGQVQLDGDGSHVYVGRELTYFVHPNPRSAIIRVPFSGGAPQVLLRVRGYINGFAVSPDDRLLVYSFSRPDVAPGGKYSSGIRLRDLISGTERRLRAEGAGFTFSQDGRTVAYTARRADAWVIGLLHIVDGLPGERDFLPPPEGAGEYWSAPRFRVPDHLIVTQGCCWIAGGKRIPDPHFEVDETYRVRQLLLDSSTGEVLDELPSPRRDTRFIDWDVSGDHALLAGERVCGAHACSSRLFRLGANRDLIDLDVFVVDADW